MSVTPLRTRSCALFVCLASCLSLPAQESLNLSILAPKDDNPAQLTRRAVGAGGIQLKTGGNVQAVLHVFVWLPKAKTPFKLIRASSGVVVTSQGLVLCNGDQIAEAVREPGKHVLKVQTQDGSEYPARLLDRDPATDLALLKVDLPAGKTLPSLALARAAKTPTGAPVRVLGFPDGKDLRSYGGIALRAAGPVRMGSKTLAAAEVLLTDAPLQAESHGAALLDAGGRLVGICNASRVGAELGQEPTLKDLQRPSFGFVLPVDRLPKVFARHLPDLRLQDPLPRAGLAATAGKVAAAVFHIRGKNKAAAQDPGNDPYAHRRIAGQGSGVLIDASGLALCNAHLVPANGQIQVVLHDGRKLSARLLSRSRASNVALLQVEAPPGKSLPFLHLGDSAAVAPGAAVLALGRAANGSLTATAGILSASRSRRGANLGTQQETGTWLQVDARIGNHNGGGALVTEAGLLIGIPDAGRVDPLRTAAARSKAQKSAEKLDTGMYFVPGINRLRRQFRSDIDTAGSSNPSLAKPATSKAPAQIPEQVVARCAASSVNVYVSWSSRAADEEENPFVRSKPKIFTRGLGSGVVITEDGLCLTNWHVVDEATEPTGAAKKDHAVHVRLRSGEKYECEVISISREDDLALIQIQLPAGKSLQAAELGDSERLQVGETVVALGNPKGAQNTATAGVIVAKNQGIRVKGRWAKLEPLLQTDAAINGGNSGGGLFDACGRLIGINSAGGGGRKVTSYAIPVNHVRQRVNELLLSAKKMRRIYLGMRLADEGGRILVRALNPQGPAARAGIKVGDRLRELDGQPLRWTVGFKLDLRKRRAGQPLRFAVERGDQTIERSFKPLSAAAWALFKQAGLVCSDFDLRNQAALMQAASIAIHRGFTNTQGTPSELRGSAVRIDRLVDGAHEEHPARVRVGDLIFGIELRGHVAGGSSRALKTFADCAALAAFFNSREYASYEGISYTAWVYRDGKALAVPLRAKRLLY